MAKAIKALLLPKDNPYGNGLASIRTLESKMVDISDWEDCVSDNTMPNTQGYFIKNNKVYRVVKSYFDFDKNWRIFLAIEDTDTYDVYPIPKKR